MDRKAEIRKLLRLTPEQVIERAGKHLVVCDDLDQLHRRFAEDIAKEIRSGAPRRFIMPVGPVLQYPHLAETINRERLSLKNVTFFFMDEYCAEDGSAVSAAHPLSFKGEAARQFFDRLDPALRPAPEQVIFPDEKNVAGLAGLVADGGVDVCFGGIGLHGHVAFNEPEPGVSAMGPRRVMLNDFTVTINGIRAGIGGNLECFPRAAFTLGMVEVLGSRAIRLYCRNGYGLDWANTVLRLALLGEPGDDYPVTHIRNGNYVITTDRNTLSSPKNML